MAPIDGNEPHENPQDFIDPKGYWADGERGIRRTSGQRQVVLKATNSCTEAEWMFVLESLGLGTTEGGHLTLRAPNLPAKIDGDSSETTSFALLNV